MSESLQDLLARSATPVLVGRVTTDEDGQFPTTPRGPFRLELEELAGEVGEGCPVEFLPTSEYVTASNLGTEIPDVGTRVVVMRGPDGRHTFEHRDHRSSTIAEALGVSR
ncbi:MAG: hypothetical protein P4L84_33060 [Isosphaeraceae bacterium]|nr:hypothetical protein [Isosphaeraceae bacterium]